VIHLNPNSAVAYYCAGNAYRETKQFDQALASYSEAIRLDPVNPQPYVDCGVIHYLEGQFDEAITDTTRRFACGNMHYDG
jgi:cytochrome c-type biogenesis protein CcmH/NrfG